MLRAQANEAERDEPKYVLRTAITDDLKAFLERPETNAMGKKQRAWSGAAETVWLSPERQHEEAWFLGLRLSAGVDVAELERELDECRRKLEAKQLVEESKLLARRILGGMQ